MTSPNTIIADMQAEIDALRKENEDLLFALNLLYSWAYNWDSEFMNDPGWIHQDVHIIKAAIANSKANAKC